MCQHCDDLVESMIFRNWLSLSTIRRHHLSFGGPPACDEYRSSVQQYYSNMEKAWQWGKPKGKSIRVRTAIQRVWLLSPDLEDSGLVEAVWQGYRTQSSIRYDARWGWRDRHPANPEVDYTDQKQQQVSLMD